MTWWLFPVCFLVGGYCGLAAANGHWLLFATMLLKLAALVGCVLWWRSSQRGYRLRAPVEPRAELTFTFTNPQTHATDLPPGTIVQTSDGKRFVIDQVTSDTTATIRGCGWWDRVRDWWHRMKLKVSYFYWRIRG
jgi:hypothetical protein